MRKRQPSRRVSSDESGDPAAVFGAAVTLLSRRDYGSAELASRLISRGFEPDTVQAALEELRARHYLDDERYVRQFVDMHARRGHGPVRIRHELSQLGLSSEASERSLADYGDWSALARAIRARKFGAHPPRTWQDKARQARFLQYRGFSNEDIRSALGFEATDDC